MRQPMISPPPRKHPRLRADVSPFSRAVSVRPLAASLGSPARLPTIAALASMQLLLAACGKGRENDPTVRPDEVPLDRTNAVASARAIVSAHPPILAGVAATLDEPIPLAPPPPPPPPKPVLGKPHNIAPPKNPYPMAGDMEVVKPRPRGNGTKSA